MSRILVLYGTTDGHTAKIAARLGETFREAGCDVAVAHAGSVVTDAWPERYDGVVVAASVHIGSYQRPVRRWVEAHAEQLSRMPSAFLSVCLGILEHQPEVDRELQDMFERFLRRTGWRPTVVKPVAGAVPYTRYGWFKKWMMRRMVAKVSGDTDTTRDYEYTDWEDLRTFAQDFLHRVDPAITGAMAGAGTR
jgi:menaquinone-dependent protoporphyrinogen oxidase